MFLGIYLLLLGCPIVMLLLVVSSDPLYFHGVSSNISFISDFTYLSPPSFFISECSWRSVNFINLFKEWGFGFNDISYCLFSLFLFPLLYLLFSSFYWIWVSVILFQVLCVVKLGFFIFLLFFLRQAFVLMNFPLRTA